MCLRSVITVVFEGNNNSQHFALHPAEWRVPHHDGKVEADAGAHCFRIKAHDVSNIPYPTCAGYGAVELSLEQSFGLVDWDLFDPGHAGISLSGMI